MGIVAADEAQRSGLDGQDDRLVRGISRAQGQDTDLEVRAGHLADEVDAAVAGQHQIDQQHIRLQGFGLSNGRSPVVGHAHHLDVFHLIEARRQGLSLAWISIYNEYANRFWTH